MANHKLKENVKWITEEELLSVSWMETWLFAIYHAFFFFLNWKLAFNGDEL